VKVTGIEVFSMGCSTPWSIAGSFVVIGKEQMQDVLFAGSNSSGIGAAGDFGARQQVDDEMEA